MKTTKRQPLVSVIMNCYNGEKYLSEAIESVLKQTYRNFEIIFWDNVSTDKSRSIVESYKNDRIKYFLADKHTLLGEARNSALQKVEGEFLTFLDCDDWWELNRLERVICEFRDEDVGIVYSNGFIYYSDDGRYKNFYRLKQKQGWLFKSLIGKYNLYMPSIIIRKNALNSLNYFFNPKFSMIEEAELVIRIARTWKVSYVDQNLCFWRAHKDSLSWRKQDDFANENTIFINYLESNYTYLIGEKCLLKYKARNSYRIFFANWKKGNVRREIISPYLLIDSRLILIYFFSFFSINKFIAILKLLGKEI